MGVGPWVRVAVGLLAVGVCAAGVPRARDPGRRRTFYSDDDDDGDDGGIGGGIGSIVDEELNYNVQRINEEKTRHGQGGNFGDDFGLPKKGGGGGGIFGGDDEDEDDDDDDSDEGDDDGKGGGGKVGGGGRRRLNEPNRPVVATNYGKLRGIRVSLPSPDAVLRSDGRGAEGPGAGPAGTPGGGPGGGGPGGGGALVVTQFLGVPYARAPRGERRFSAAEPPAVWSGEREAATRGPPCPQPVPNHRGPDWTGWGMLPVWEAGNERLATWLSSKQSEECLNLDVYIPGRDVPGERPPLAVMVFLHGGSFLDGAGGLYDGSALAAHGDVIVVIVTYRLGVLGFFSTGDSLARGNYGLLDQVMALRWVRENVGHFGGDQGRVTLVGAGTGAACASLLALSHHAEGMDTDTAGSVAPPPPPSHRQFHHQRYRHPGQHRQHHHHHGFTVESVAAMVTGLFQRVIAQSGTALSSWALNHRPELSAAALARSVGCLRPLPPPPRHRGSAPHRQQQQQRQRDVTVVGPAAMACLRRKSTEELVEASASLSEFSVSSSLPPSSSSSSPPPLSPFSFSPSHFRSVFAPTVDGEVIPDDPRALLEQGEFLNYNTMLGVAQAEGLRLAEAFLVPDERSAFSLGLGGGGGFGGGAETQGGLDGRSATVTKPGAKVAAVESRRPALSGAPPAIPEAAPAVLGTYEDRNPAGGGAFSAAFSRAVDELVDGLYAAEVVGDGDGGDDDDDSDDQDSEPPGTEALRETVRFMYTDWADRDNAEMRRKTLLALLTDHQWVAPAVATADLRSQFGSPTYFYALYQRCDGEPTPSVGAGGSTSSSGTTGVKDRAPPAVDVVLSPSIKGGGDSVASKTLTAASVPSSRAGAALAPPVPAGGGGVAPAAAASSSRPAWADAAHGDELPYVLGAPFLRPSSRYSRMFACNFSRGDAALSATVIAYWSNFAKSGDPNRPEITDDDDDDIDGGGGAGGEDGVDGGARSSVFVEVPWRRYSPREQHYLHLGPRPRLREHYRANKVAFWLELVPHLQYMASSSSTSYEGRHFTGFGATRRPPGAVGRRGPSGTGYGTTRRPKGPDRASRKDKGGVDTPGGGGGSTRRQEGGTGSGIEGGNEAGRDGDASQRRDYSTELSVTIAVGTSMLLLNVLAFAALCYKREKRRREEAGLYPCRHGHQRGGSLASSVSSVGSHRTQQHNHHGGGSNLHRHHRQPQHQQQMMVDPHHQHLHHHQSAQHLGDDQHHLQEQQQQHRRALWGDSDDEGVLPSPLDVEGGGSGGLCVGSYGASACRVLIHDDDDVIVDNGGVADNNEEDDYEEYEYDEEFRNGAGATSSLLFHHHHHNNNQQQQHHQPQQQQRQPRRKAAAMMRKRRSLTTTTTMTPQSVVDYFPDEVAVVAVPDTFECPRDYALTLRRSPEDLPLTLGLGLGLGLGLNHQGGHGHHHLHHHQGLAPHAANVAQGPGGLAQQGQQGQQGLQYQHGPVGQALPGGFGEQHKVRHC